MSTQSWGYDYPYNNMTVRKIFDLKAQPPPSQINERKITMGRPDEALPDNAIHTNKYNFITFLPKNILEQYSKIANIYFLMLGILQMIPSISNSDQQPTIWLPLFAINIATAGKDLYEDLKRKNQDSEENNSQGKIINKMGHSEVCWSSFRVGDLIRVEKNEFFPCDVLLINTSEPKGVCYIETKNLDGETNLKQKNVQKDMYALYKDEDYQSAKMIFEYERPNAYLYKFNGRVQTQKGDKISIDANNFVLRGCSLRNTRWIVGLCAYTGHDTKLMMNSFKGRAKRSHLEQSMNDNIMFVFVVMCLLSCFAAITFTALTSKHINSLSYLQEDTSNTAAMFFTNFFCWILNLSNLVPISLLVTLELVKMIQGIFIQKDQLMVYQETQTPTQVQSSSLNEELGQVQYIFSDKTGTLTCNIMEFKKMSINGISYGEVKRGQGNYQEDISAFPKVTNVDFRDKQLFDAISDEKHPEHKMVVKNMFVLALCHTIITEKQEHELIYNASSPDELALINFAKFVGVQFMGMDESNYMEVKFKNKHSKYLLLHVLEFNSTRKRMSVILKDPDGNYVLYTKGADSIILDRVDKNKSEKIPETIANLADYGRIGLRTLLLAEKYIDPVYFKDWNERYLEACSSMEKRDEKMDQLQEELEVDLIVVGATAIEDKLQDQVGETIDSLIKQGIHVWVLTGDKIETAINIAISCKLITNDMEQIIVDEKEEPALLRALDEALVRLNQADNVKAAFIISGDALLHGLKPKISGKIMQIGEAVKSVVCCRVSPKQKQEVVSLVRKEKPTTVTLAIGDGANDVNMITAAHVGVGIKGLEGAQAARSADYAIGEFKLLRRLLFYHGRECYRRNCNLILYNFFKNILLVMPQFWYGVYDLYSGPTFYDNYTQQFFNVFFASQPIMVYSVLDQEEKDSELVKNQMRFYDEGMKNQLFNRQVFWLWFANSTAQSIILTYYCIYSVSDSFDSPTGQSLNFWTTGMMVLGMIVVISNLKVLIISNEYSTGSVLVTLMGVTLYLIAVVMSTNIQYPTGQLYNDLQVFGVGNFHLGNILILIQTSLMDFGVEQLLRSRIVVQRRANYLQRLQEELTVQEDLIIFTPVTFENSFANSNDKSNKKVKVTFIPLVGEKE